MPAELAAGEGAGGQLKADAAGGRPPAAEGVGSQAAPAEEPVYAGLTRDQVMIALKAAFATLSAEERSAPEAATRSPGSAADHGGSGGIPTEPPAQTPAEASAGPSTAATPADTPAAGPSVESPQRLPAEPATVPSSTEPAADPSAAPSEALSAELPASQAGRDQLVRDRSPAPGRATIYVPADYYPSTFSHPFTPGFFGGHQFGK